MSELSETEMPLRARSLDMTVNWDINWAKLTSITAYNETSFGPATQDVDATELAILRQGRPSINGEPALEGIQGDSEAFTQELLLASAGENALDWTLGLLFGRKCELVSGFDLPGFSFSRGLMLSHKQKPTPVLDIFHTQS